MSRPMTRSAWMAGSLVLLAAGGALVVRLPWNLAYGAAKTKTYKFSFPFTNDLKDPVDDLHVVWEHKPTKADADAYPPGQGKATRMRTQADQAGDGKPMTVHDRATVPPGGSVAVDTEWEGPDDNPAMKVAWWWTLGGVMQGEVRDADDHPRGTKYPWPPKQGGLPENRRLPEGVIYATANVTEDTKIKVEQPGYALIATAEVTDLKRVKPGDTLDAATASALVFDDGRGVLINIAKAGAGLAAFVGVKNLLGQGQPTGLPVYDKAATMVVESDKPFASAEVTGDGTVLPATTYAEFSSVPGALEDKTAVLLTVREVEPSKLRDLSVRTRNAAGATVQEHKIDGGILDGTPRVTFDQNVYRKGQAGVLRITNLHNYVKAKEAAGFGLTNNLAGKDILLQATNAKGLPSKIPFDPAKDAIELPFRAGRPGAVQAAVILPGAVPAQPPAGKPAAKTPEHLQQANAAFEKWRKQTAIAAALGRDKFAQPQALLKTLDDGDLADHCYNWTCPNCGKTWTCYLKFCPRCWAQNGGKQHGVRGSKIGE